MLGRLEVLAKRCKTLRLLDVLIRRGHSDYELSQWEATLQCNVASQWLSPKSKWSLRHQRLWIRFALCRGLIWLDTEMPWRSYDVTRCVIDSNNSGACYTMSWHNDGLRVHHASISDWIYEWDNALSGLILGLHPGNERRRYKVTPSLIGWAQT